MPGIKRMTAEELKEKGYNFLTDAEIFAKYEPNPSDLIKWHDARNEKLEVKISMPGLRTKEERLEIYRDWEMQDASAKFVKKGKF